MASSTGILAAALLLGCPVAAAVPSCSRQDVDLRPEQRLRGKVEGPNLGTRHVSTGSPWHSMPSDSTAVSVVDEDGYFDVAGGKNALAFLDIDDDGQYDPGADPSALCAAIGAAAELRCDISLRKLALSRQQTFRGRLTGGNPLRLDGEWVESLALSGEFFDDEGRSAAGAQLCWHEQQACSAVTSRSARVDLPKCDVPIDTGQHVAVEIGGERIEVAFSPAEAIGRASLRVSATEDAVALTLSAPSVATDGQFHAEVRIEGGLLWSSSGPSTIRASTGEVTFFVPATVMDTGATILLDALASGPGRREQEIIARELAEVRAVLHWESR